MDLILQLLSYLTFYVIFRHVSHPPSHALPKYAVGGPLLASVGLGTPSCPCLWHCAIRHSHTLVRVLNKTCANSFLFRTVEDSQGSQGYLSVHEGYFDALPLSIAIDVLVLLWPERLLRPHLYTGMSLESLYDK